MKHSLILLVGVSLSLLTLHSAIPQSADELRRLEELDRICLKAREAKLREVQRQKIEACIKEPQVPREAPKSRAECERYWGDYGWTQGTASGSARPHLFADLPECVQAFEARQKYQGR
jgi:hypothetical protein